MMVLMFLIQRHVCGGEMSKRTSAISPRKSEFYPTSKKKFYLKSRFSDASTNKMETNSSSVVNNDYKNSKRICLIWLE